MRVKYLELYKYKRFPLLGKDRLVIDFTSKLNLILGCNGSGKTSLLNELSPLPSSKDDFYEHGYKCIVIEHNKRNYTLISDIANNSYSFLLDEEELNPSHLITIQKELVATHFSLTQDVWDILTGKVSFSDMTLIQRKKLFNTLSHLNIETIVDIYNEHKDKLKEQQMLLKTQSNLYTIEANKLLDPTLLDTLQARLELNNTHMGLLMEMRAHLTTHAQVSSDNNRLPHYLALCSSIKALTQQHYTLLTSYPYKQYETNKAEIASHLTLCEFRLQDLYAQMESLEMSLKSIELKKTHTRASIEDKLLVARQSVQTQTSKLVYIQNLSGSIKTDIHTLYYQLSDLVSEMPLNASKQYSKAVYEQTLQTKSELLKDKQMHYHMQVHLTKEIDLQIRQKEDNQVTCPNCSTSWVLNYDPLKHRSFSEKKAATDVKLLEIDAALLKCDEYLQAFSEYMTKYRQYAQIRQTYLNSMPQLFAAIDQSEYIFTNPRGILTFIDTAISDVNSLVDIATLEQDIRALEKDLEVVSCVDTQDAQAIHTAQSDTTEAIHEILQAKKLYSEQAQHNEFSYGVARNLISLETVMNETQAQILERNLSYTVQKVITSIDTELSHIRLQNIETQNQVTNHHAINTLIARYKADLDNTTESIEVLKAITQELNPKSGIIGRIISNYLNSIIEYVNKIIHSLWNYKMELVAYNLESDVLDYRFKINVEDKLSVKDITLASSGMKEIINLAFKLAMMKLLNLGEYTLFLDEFGARLDSEHRGNIYNLVFKFLSDDSYSQIFLITHTDLAYSNFKDTTVIQMS